MNDEEFDRLASKIDWRDAEDCDSPSTQEFLDVMSGIRKKKEGE